MIPFFRKIRKKLADDNKPLKYLRYAIGEIILVVIGILIALQINNWKENKLERKQEKAILNQLNSEFKSNLDQLDEKIKSKTELMKSVLKLLNYLNPYYSKAMSTRNFTVKKLIMFRGQAPRGL